jgi:hypothetical protein
MTASWRSFTPGYPTKVVTTNVEPVTKLTTLAGERCSDHQRLRFWIDRSDLPFGQQELPVSAERLESTGDLAVAFEPHWARVNSGGYMMFSSADRFRIWTSEGDQVVASATIQVG